MSATLTAVRASSGHAQILWAVLRKFRLFAILAAPLLLIAGGLALYFGGRDMLVKAMPSFVAFGLIFVWWGAFMALQAQNHPVAARLVPGQLRQLREVALALMLTIALVDGVLMQLVVGHWLAWAILSTAACLLFSILIRWPMLWLTVWIIPSTASTWWKTPTWQTLMAVMQDWHARQPVTQAALAIGLMSVVMWRLFQSGGPSHGGQYQRAAALRQAMKEQAFSGRAANLFPEGRFARLFRGLFCWLRNLWCHHLVRSARPTAASALARAELVGSPSTHWSMVVGTSLVIIAGMAVFFLVGYSLAGDGDRALKGLRSALGGFSFGLMSMLINPVMSAPAALYKRRREQALLMLLPTMPRGEALNRGLARRQMIQFISCLGFGLLIVSGLQFGWRLQGPHASDEMLSMMSVHYATLALPASLILWRDWSKQREPNSAHTALLVMALVGGMVVLGAVMPMLGISAWVMLGVSAALTALVAMIRWRRVVKLPTFWPTGRWG